MGGRAWLEGIWIKETLWEYRDKFCNFFNAKKYSWTEGWIKDNICIEMNWKKVRIQRRLMVKVRDIVSGNFLWKSFSSILQRKDTLYDTIMKKRKGPGQGNCKKFWQCSKDDTSNLSDLEYKKETHRYIFYFFFVTLGLKYALSLTHVPNQLSYSWGMNIQLYWPLRYIFFISSSPLWIELQCRFER